MDVASDARQQSKRRTEAARNAGQDDGRGQVGLLNIALSSCAHSLIAAASLGLMPSFLVLGFTKLNY